MLLEVILVLSNGDFFGNIICIICYREYKYVYKFLGRDLSEAGS